MNLRSNILALSVIGHDLAIASVEVSPLGANVRRVGVLREALRAGPVALSDMLAGTGIVPHARHIVFTPPSGSCSMRPIALGVANWSKAREEVLASIGRLFPMTRDDALVGLVERSPAASLASQPQQPAQGYLFAIRREQIEPWAHFIEQALGRAPDTVLAPPMVTLGLGLQDTPEAGVIDRSPGAMLTIHRLAYSNITSLSEPWAPDIDDSAALAGIRLLQFPAPENTPPILGVDRIDPVDYAAAAGLAIIVGAGRIAPLLGKTPNRIPRWLTPAAAILLAATLIGISLPLRDARYDDAISAIEREQQEIQPEFVRVSAIRQQTHTRLAALNQVVNSTYTNWRRSTPDLVALHQSLPEGAFIYRYTLDTDALSIQGEAPRAADVLLAIERSHAFSGAEQVTPPSVVPDRSLERFHIRAQREKGGSP